MKRLVIALLAVTLLSTPAYAFESTQALPHDKALHVIAGTVIFAGCNAVGVNKHLCLLTSVLVGIGKEVLWDTKGDKYDALATAGGGLLGYSISFKFWGP